MKSQYPTVFTLGTNCGLRGLVVSGSGLSLRGRLIGRGDLRLRLLIGLSGLTGGRLLLELRSRQHRARATVVLTVASVVDWSTLPEAFGCHDYIAVA